MMQANVTQNVARAFSLCQQAATELSIAMQTAQQGIVQGAQAYGQAYAQPAGINSYGSPLAQVMQADRFVDQQEATPSYYRYASAAPYGQPSPGYASAQQPYSY